MFSAILLVLLLTLRSSSPWSYFCDLNCGSDENMVCSREPCPKNSHCGVEFKKMEFTYDEQKEILRRHNKIRSNMSMGVLKGADDVSFEAANMRVLSYSRELAFIAQCWANTCDMDGPPICMRTRRYNVAYNAYIRSVPLHYRSMDVIRQALHYWTAERQKLTMEVVEKTPPEPTLEDEEQLIRITVHLTQIVWAKTAYVGCGRTMFGHHPEQRSVMVMCAYAPGGNIVGEPVFKRGKPCSQCGGEECNPKFVGLCGRSFRKDLWMPPFDIAGSRGRWRGSWTWVAGLVSLWVCV